MLSFTNTQFDDPFSTTYNQGPAVIRFPVGFTGVTEFMYLWNATARPGENSTGQRGSKIDTSLRTSVTTYARGLKERITVSTNNGTAWQWRRSLVIFGGTRLGKTLWARSLGNHAYFGGLFSLDESLEDVENGIVDVLQ